MSNLSDEAFGKITTILAPYLTRSLNIVGNPMPEIKAILDKLDNDAYTAGTLHGDPVFDAIRAASATCTCFGQRLSHD